MKRIFALAVAACAVSACTIQQQGTELKQEFNPPLTYASWKIERYETQSGRQVCEVTSGYNGLTIAQSRDGKHTPVAARGERKMTPGMEFSVNVAGNHYRTSQEYFSFSEAPRLAEDLSMGGKAYLEWSEPHGDNHGRLRSSNIVKLDDFKARFEECRKSLLK
jgi:hypothetical protein